MCPVRAQGSGPEQWRTIGVGPFPYQVQCERSYIKPYNPFVPFLIPVPVLQTASVIKLLMCSVAWPNDPKRKKHSPLFLQQYLFKRGGRVNGV